MWINRCSPLVMPMAIIVAIGANALAENATATGSPARSSARDTLSAGRVPPWRLVGRRSAVSATRHPRRWSLKPYGPQGLYEAAVTTGIAYLHYPLRRGVKACAGVIRIGGDPFHALTWSGLFRANVPCSEGRLALLASVHWPRGRPIRVLCVRGISSTAKNPCENEAAATSRWRCSLEGTPVSQWSVRCVAGRTTSLSAARPWSKPSVPSHQQLRVPPPFGPILSLGIPQLVTVTVYDAGLSWQPVALPEYLVIGRAPSCEVSAGHTEANMRSRRPNHALYFAGPSPQRPDWPYTTFLPSPPAGNYLACIYAQHGTNDRLATFAVSLRFRVRKQP